MPTKTREILVAARDLIDDPAKWASGDGNIPLGCYCAQTAISRSAGAFSEAMPACKVFAIANGIDPASITDIWNWNDAPGRTHAEVVAAFNKAIAGA